MEGGGGRQKKIDVADNDIRVVGRGCKSEEKINNTRKGKETRGKPPNLYGK